MSTATVRRWCQTGRLPARMTGRRWTIAPEAFEVEPEDAEASVQVVGVGLDTVAITWTGYVSDEVLRHLEERQELARELDGGAGVVTTDLGSGVHELAVKPYGGAGWPFLLQNDEVAILLGPPAGTRPSVMATLSSFALWSRGWRRAVEELDALVRGLGDLEQGQLSRIDLAVDLAGATDALMESGREEWVTRARDVTQFHQGLASTGYRWGKSATVARLYNKSREVRSSAKTWFYPLWKANGWGGDEVARMEFQLRREAIKALAPADLTAEPWAILDELASTWRYLTESWLRWARPQRGEARSRWATRAAWQAIQSAFDNPDADDPEPAAIRQDRSAARFDQLLPQVAGCMTSCAVAARQSDAGELAGEITGEVVGYLDQRLRDHEEAAARREEREPRVIELGDGWRETLAAKATEVLGNYLHAAGVEPAEAVAAIAGSAVDLARSTWRTRLRARAVRDDHQAVDELGVARWDLHREQWGRAVACPELYRSREQRAREEAENATTLLAEAELLIEFADE